MTQPVAKLLVGFFIVTALLVVAAVVLTLSQPAPPKPQLPQPNGYDDLVKAGDMVTDDPSGYGTMIEEQLRAFLKKNAESLKLAREGLGRKCRVPLNFSATNTTYVRNLAALKRLALSLAAEGRLAEMENRPADAAKAYLAIIHLGCAISQGGVIIDSLVSIAVDTIGTARLEKLTPTLDAKQCREAAAALESCEAQREPTEVIVLRERAWSRRIWGFKGQVVRLVMFKSLRQTEQGWAAREKARQTRTRSLLVQLASRAYELENGQRPKSLADLAPPYLKSIPENPLSGTNTAYHP
jgi:hypothetical protein